MMRRPKLTTYSQLVWMQGDMNINRALNTTTTTYVSTVSHVLLAWALCYLWLWICKLATMHFPSRYLLNAINKCKFKCKCQTHIKRKKHAMSWKLRKILLGNNICIAKYNASVLKCEVREKRRRTFCCNKYSHGIFLISSVSTFIWGCCMKDHSTILKLTKGKKAPGHKNMVNSLFEDNLHSSWIRTE